MGNPRDAGHNASAIALSLHPDKPLRLIFDRQEYFRRCASGAFLSPPTKERSKDMFTRVVELTSKSGKSKELASAISEKVVPLLKKQRGFVDEVVLVSDTEPLRILGISFWDKREDAEQYHREQYPKVQETVRHLLEAEPVVRTFDVHTYVGQKIAAGKAA
jgi:heme-degrading monooxygenase HmoA